jgi:hypothetical protein
MIQIKIERIGDDARAGMELWRRVLNDACGPGIGDVVIGRMPSRAWCAEITGPDPRFGFARAFLKPNISYLQANGVGSRGVFAFYNLEEGCIYEVSSPQSWKRTDRYFCRVAGGSLLRLEKKEVQGWLNKPGHGR